MLYTAQRPSSVANPNTRAAVAATALAFASSLATTAAAQTVLLTFEGSNTTFNAPGQTVPESSRLRDQYLAAYHIRFSSGSGYAALIFLGLNHAVSGVLGLGGTTPQGTLAYGPAYPVRGEFVAPDGVTPLTTAHLAISGDLACADGDKHLRAYGLSGQVLGMVTVPDCAAGPLRIDVPGIHRFEAWGDSATVAFDDVEFTLPPACGSADFNGDGDTGTDQDIEVFFRCLSGSCCAACPLNADFNGDGDVGTDADIESFFRVLAGGHC